jgi:putative hemolysin
MINSIILLIVLIFLSALFSGTEIAMFSLSDHKIRHLIEKKVRGAKLLYSLKNDSHKLLITILIGNNVVNIGAASLATFLALELFGNVGVGIATGVMTFLILFFGEIIPKAFATKNAQPIALFTAQIINILKYLFYPFVLFFNMITKLVIPTNQANSEDLLTEDEVKGMLKLSGEQGEIKQQEQEMIQNIFKLDDTVAEQIMTPRPKVFALEKNSKLGDVLDLILEKGYSRIPIYENELDSIEGVVYVKDLLGADLSKKLSDFMRTAFFVLESKKIDSLLYDFKQKQSHLAIVVNEHGTVVGVISIEDLLEEIVGEIYDETDDPLEESSIKKLSEGHYLILGDAELTDVDKLLSISICSRTENNTLSGLLVEALTRIPSVGEKISLQNYVFTILAVDETKILEIEAKKQ